jgi:methionine-rich copper-binding protein CopC
VTPLLALLLATIVSTPVPSAEAHSLLIFSSPAPGAVVKASPSLVVLRFNNRIEKRLSRVRLVDDRGRIASAPITQADDETPDSLLAVVPPLAPGAWRVEWQVFSTDGHVVSGTYGFRLAP